MNRLIGTAFAVIVAVSLALTITGAAAAQQDTPDEDALRAMMSARSFRCSFPQYSTVDWDRDEPQLRTGSEDDFVVQIDGIDYRTQTARVIGNVGADELMAVAGATSVSFTEQTPSGAVHLTSIYAWRDSMGRFKAVYSRHTAIFGPTPSQYFGYCEVWQ